METRKRIRLSGYDYSQDGAYFVTVCTRNREPLFWEQGEVAGADEVRPNAAASRTVPLSEAGRIVDRAIQNIPHIYAGVWVEKYVVMPDHVHLLLVIEGGRMISAPTVGRDAGGAADDGGRMISAPTVGRDAGGTADDGRRMISAPTVPTVIGGMKRWASKQCGRTLWQKSFIDHIIRDENDFLTRWNYIDTNPARRQKREERL